MLSIRPHFDSARPRPASKICIYERPGRESLQFHDSRAVIRCYLSLSIFTNARGATPRREYLIKNMCSAKIECSHPLEAAQTRDASPHLHVSRAWPFPLLDTLLREKQLFKRAARRQTPLIIAAPWFPFWPFWVLNKLWVRQTTQIGRKQTLRETAQRTVCVSFAPAPITGRD